MTGRIERTESTSHAELYAAIVAAEQAARHAHDLSYEVKTPLWTRLALGRAQSILMHYVVHMTPLVRSKREEA